MHAASTSSVINCAGACNSPSHAASAAFSCARVKLHVEGMIPYMLCVIQDQQWRGRNSKATLSNWAGFRTNGL